MTNSTDSKTSKKKVRLTYCIGTPGRRRQTKVMNLSRSIVNKSLNKSRVIRTIRTNNSALAKKLNSVQVELTKAEEETLSLRDNLQIAQQDDRHKENCLRDISRYFDDIFRLLLAVGKKVDEGLKGPSTPLKNNSESAPLNTTITLEEVDQTVKSPIIDPRLVENPFIRRDRIPRTPPLANITASYEESSSIVLGSSDVQDNKVPPMATVPSIPVEKKKKERREVFVEKPDIKCLSLISEQPNITSGSDKITDSDEREPDILVEKCDNKVAINKMLNELLSHGITESLAEEFAASPLPPPVSTGDLQTGLSSKRRSAAGTPRKSVVSPLRLPPSNPTPPLTPTTSSETNKSSPISATRTAAVVLDRVDLDETEDEVEVKKADVKIVKRPKKVSEAEPNAPTKRKIAKKDANMKKVDKKVKLDSGKTRKPSDKPPSSSERPIRKENGQSRGILVGKGGKSEAHSVKSVQFEESSPIQSTDKNAEQTVVRVEAKKPGVLKFSAVKPGEEKAKTKGKTKKGRAPKSKKTVVKESSKEPVRVKSVFDFSMSDTMNETAKVPPTLSEFREKSEDPFKKPKPVDDKENKLRTQIPTATGDKPTKHRSATPPILTEIQKNINAGDSGEFQQKKTSVNKTKKFKRLITFDDSFDELPKEAKFNFWKSRQQKMKKDSTPSDDNGESAGRSRRRAPVSYKEPKSNVKLRRGDADWCRK